MEFLRNIGVDFVQGHLFGKPMKLSDFNSWMAGSETKGLRLVA
jgi:EAL domain-containing protein (putative c-di-GMP-specific phosphodiesterase class I)